MSQRTLALTRQRIFFSDLSAVEELVLTTKNRDRCALNIQGRFELIDPCWKTAEWPQNETLLALSEEREAEAPTEMPHVPHKRMQETLTLESNKQVPLSKLAKI